MIDSLSLLVSTSMLTSPWLLRLLHRWGADQQLVPKPGVDTIDTVEGVCNGFLPYTRFLGFPEFSGYHQWQQESQ